MLQKCSFLFKNTSMNSVTNNRTCCTRCIHDFLKQFYHICNFQSQISQSQLRCYVGSIRSCVFLNFYTVGMCANPDTNGAEGSAIVSEVSSFQRLKCMQEWYLGWEKVPCLERCPHFMSILRERGSTVGIICSI